MRALVVEDDKGIADGLQATLSQQGWAVEVCASVGAAWASLCAEAFDVVLLDLGLPDQDGSTLLGRIRAQAPGAQPEPRLPVLIMTARDQVASRIAGLDMGADDYVTKPFSPDELAARMRALVRRASGRADPLIRCADLEIDPSSRTVRRGGQLIDLSTREFGLLLTLVEARPRVLTRAQVEAKLYTWHQALDSNAIEVHIHHLRKKLGEGLIRTVRGVGYFIPEDRA